MFTNARLPQTTGAVSFERVLEGPVAYVYSDAGYVQFGFFNGSSLKDPKGLLEGKGQYVRHIKVRTPSAIDERAFAALLRQATQSLAVSRVGRLTRARS